MKRMVPFIFILLSLRMLHTPIAESSNVSSTPPYS